MRCAWRSAGFTGLICAVAVLFVSGTAGAQQYKWNSDVPPPLFGTWVVEGQSCTDQESTLLIFTDGGYRWRRSRTEWGFARGKFDWARGDAKVYFRLQRFVQQEIPDFQFTVSGSELRKYNFGSNLIGRYVKCPEN